jgi:hypothetical protein
MSIVTSQLESGGNSRQLLNVAVTVAADHSAGGSYNAMHET